MQVVNEVCCGLDERLGPFQSEVARLCTIPGVDRVTAWGLLAEIGLSMKQFPEAQHRAGWAGLGPGSCAGKRKSGRIRKGSLWLRQEAKRFVGCLSPAGSAKRIETRDHCGAHKLLAIAYYILRAGTYYREPGAACFDRLNPEGLTQALNRTTRRLGLQSDPGAP
jgi:transposase